MTAALLTRLMEAGTPMDLVAEVAMALAKASAAMEAIEQRRQADRSRKQRERDKPLSRDITGHHGTSEEAADVTAAAPPDEYILTPPNPSDEAKASSEALAQKARKTRSARRKKGNERKQVVGSRLAAGWQPPAIDALPLEHQAIVAKWPDGAYPLTALQFRNHWLAEGRAIGAKRDWMRTWCNWLYRENAQILLLVKRGFDFSAGRAAEAPAAAGPERETAAGHRLHTMRQAESKFARMIRQRIRDDAGERTYAGWIAPAAITVDGGEVIVTSASDFMSSWLEQHFAATFQGVAGNVLGRPARVFFRVLKLDSG